MGARMKRAIEGLVAYLRRLTDKTPCRDDAHEWGDPDVPDDPAWKVAFLEQKCRRRRCGVRRYVPRMPL